MSEWQPIATAPEDSETEILGCLTYGDVQLPVVMSFYKGSENVRRGWYNARSGHEYRDALTHWMPLPELPGMPQALTKAA